MNILNNPEAVLTLKNGDVVFVGDRECIFNKCAGHDRFYFTATDSKPDAYQAACEDEEAKYNETDPPFPLNVIGEVLYADYIFHVRAKVEAGQGAAVFSRKEFVEMFKSGNYVIA